MANLISNAARNDIEIPFQSDVCRGTADHDFEKSRLNQAAIFAIHDFQLGCPRDGHRRADSLEIFDGDAGDASLGILQAT